MLERNILHFIISKSIKKSLKNNEKMRMWEKSS